MSNCLPSKEFLDLFAAGQLRLYRYIVLLVGNQAEAEDVLQNTNLVLLRKCDQFQPGSNFTAWSTGIAHLEVLKHRSSRARREAALSDETIEMLSADARRQSDMLEMRNSALPGCIEKLPPADRNLVAEHYFHGLSWERIAATIGRSASSVRHSICRIRRELKRCIDATVGAEDEA